MYHELLTARPEWAEKAATDAAIDRAEGRYRLTAEAVRNLQDVGWTQERREAALAGEVLIVDPDSVQQHGPLLNLDKAAGRQVTQQLSPWAEFSSLRGRVNEERVELLAALHDEISGQAVDRERQLLEAVPDMRVQDLGQVAEELTRLVVTLGACRAAAGVRPREGALREQVTPLEVFAAAAAYAAGQAYSLLTPVVADRSIVDAVGLNTEYALTPAKATQLPPANVIMQG